MVIRLQAKVEELQEELQLATGNERTDELSADERTKSDLLAMSL